MSTTLTTESQFASGLRSRAEDIIAAHRELSADELLMTVLNAMPLMVGILDENRHMVCANKLMIDNFGGGNIDVVLGTRPGEMVGCCHAWDNEMGCGTSISCRYCGAVAAVLAAQKGRTITRECRIMTPLGSDPLDLSIKASPFSHHGIEFTLIAIENIAAEKRREILERTFFHDVMNTAGNIQGIADLVAESTSCEDIKELIPLIQNLGEQMVSEIQSQRDLLNAEKGDLRVTLENLEVVPFLDSVVKAQRNADYAMGRKIILDKDIDDHPVRTGPVLLRRLLGNLLKNALEASQPGDVVTLGCCYEEPATRFWVKNPGVMTEEVQRQIFQRSFSTKGPGRGLGTYSVRLLGEQYLKGVVSFTSSEDEGTIFSLSIPNRTDD